eukprot:15462574-Alexandrium_andersonii.AAC.1
MCLQVQDTRQTRTVTTILKRATFPTATTEKHTCCNKQGWRCAGRHRAVRPSVPLQFQLRPALGASESTWAIWSVSSGTFVFMKMISFRCQSHTALTSP